MPITFANSMTLTAAASVWYRMRWADSWTSVNLHATSVGLTMLPDPAVAELEWDYGRVMSESSQTLDVQTKQNWLGRYIKIVIPAADGDILWVGFVDGVTDIRGGIDVTDPSGPVAYGMQRITAYDMSQALHHEPILDAYWTPETPTDPFTSVAKLEAPLTFNDGGLPNRSPTKLTSGIYQSVNSSYVFCDDPSTAPHWTSRDMIEYLLAWHSPRKPSGAIGIPFECPDASFIPSTEIREIPLQGTRVMDVIDEILDRRVALSATVGYDSGTNKNQLRLHSTTDVSVQGIPANANQIDLVLWSDPATKLTSTAQATNLIHQVLARGERRIVISDAKTAKGWETADEAKYKAGASGDPDYGPTDWEKNEQTDLVRQQSPIREVYRRLVIKKDLRFLGDVPSETRPDYFPFRKFIGIEKELPIDPNADFATVVPKLRREYKDSKENMAYIKLEYFPDGSSTTGRAPAYQFVEQAKEVSVIYDPEGASIDVDMIGQFQHYLTKDTDFLDIDVVFPDAIEILDIKFTLAFTDGRLATAPFPANPTDRDQTRRIVLDFPGYDLIEIMPDTVVGLKVKKLEVKKSDGGFVVDSRPELAKLAERAAAWFCVPRSIISVQSGRITAAIAIGQLVKTVDAGTVMAEQPKSVITSIRYDLPRVFDQTAPPPSMSFHNSITQLSIEEFS